MRFKPNLLCLLLPLVDCPTWAENSQNAELETIIVSGKKTPAAKYTLNMQVSLIERSELENAAVWSLDELGNLAVGLTIRQRGARTYDNLTLRGQSSLDFYVPNTQIYVDGLAQDPASFGQLLPVNIRAVEVLYGPQGTLFGAGAVGGVVSVITDKPGEGETYALSVSNSNLGQQVGGRLNHSLLDNQLHVDLAGNYQDTDGEYTDTLSGEERGASTSKQWQARTRWAPRDSRWDVQLSARHDDIHSSEEQYVPQAQFHKRKAFPVKGYYELTLDSYGLQASYDFDAVRATSVTSYQDRDLDRTVFSIFSPETRQSWSQELRIASQPLADQTFSYVAGLYYEDTDFTFARPDYQQISEQSMQTLALFGELTWSLTDRLDLTSGLRYDRNKVEASAGVADFSAQGKDSFHSLTPKISLGYLLHYKTRAYLLYSQGSKAGGFTRIATPTTVGLSYEPQKVNNLEVGITTRMLDNRLGMSGALYYTQTDDYQLNVGLQPNQYLDNVGETQVKGANLELSYKPAAQLTLTAMLAINKAKFSDYQGDAQDLTGNYTPYVPKQSANISAEYILPVTNGFGELKFYSQLAFNGEMYFDQENRFMQAAYSLWNAGVHWVVNASLDMRFFGSNLGDKVYAPYMFDYGEPLGQFFQLGKGREVGLKVNYRY